MSSSPREAGDVSKCQVSVGEHEDSLVLERRARGINSWRISDSGFWPIPSQGDLPGLHLSLLCTQTAVVCPPILLPSSYRF